MDPRDMLSGSDRLIEAKTLNSIALSCEAQEAYDQAARFFETALRIYQAVFGQDHFTTLLVARNLARVLRVQGNAAEADDLEFRIASSRGADGDTCTSPLGGSTDFFDLMGLDPNAQNVTVTPEL